MTEEQLSITPLPNSYLVECVATGADILAPYCPRCSAYDKQYQQHAYPSLVTTSPYMA